VLKEEPEQREALSQLRQIHEGRGAVGEGGGAAARLVELDGQGQEILAHHLAEHSRPKRAAAAEEALAIASRAVELCRPPPTPSSRSARRLSLSRSAEARRRW